MKKLLLLLTLLGVFAVGCETLFPDKQKSEPDTVFFTDGEGTYVIEPEGGRVVVTIATNIDYTVVIPEEAQSWISLDETRSEGRIDVKAFVIMENEVFEPRTTNIELVDSRGNVLKTLVFTQNCYEKLFESDVEPDYVVDVMGGEISVAVTTNMEYSVVVPKAAQSWLSVSVAETRIENRDETLTFIFTENESFNKRSAVVELVSDGETLQKISFVQNCYEKVFETDAELDYVIDVKGCEISAAVTTNMEYSVVIPKEAQSWLSVSVAETRIENRDEILTFVIDANESFEKRSAEVKFVAYGETVRKILFVQNCYEKVFETDAEPNYVIDVKGGEVNVAVTTNMVYSVVIPEEAQSWLSVSVAETRIEVRDEILNFIIAANESFEERSVEVELVGYGETLQKITFAQNCYSKVFETDAESSYVVDADGCEISVAVNTNLEYDIVIPTAAQSWLSVNVVDTRIEVRNEILTFVIAENKLFEDRSADVELVAGEDGVLHRISFVQSAALPKNYCPSNQIWYTNGSTTEPTMPYDTNAFSANIVSNSYNAKKECWIMKFDGNVAVVGDNAFYGCKDITSVIIGDDVTTIGNHAFYECSNLMSVAIPDSVTAIRNYAFAECHGLTCVYIKDLSAWCRIDFGYNGANPLCYAKNLYLNEELVTELVIPSDIVKIKLYAFYNCTSITSVTIGENVTAIGNLVFSYCTNLTEFKGKFASEDGRCLIIDGTLNSFAPAGLTEYALPNGVNTIGNYAFYGCEELINIAIPDCVTAIGGSTFANCRNLTSVTIPENVTTIGAWAFANCNNLTSVYCEATTPPAGDSYIFSNNGYGRKIYVPMESVDAYKSAVGWSSYADAIVGYDFE